MKKSTTYFSIQRPPSFLRSLKCFFLSSAILIGGVALLLLSFSYFYTPSILARGLAYPDSRVTEQWRTRLGQGGEIKTSSPAVADVRSDIAGLEIAIGSYQVVNRNGKNYPASLALLDKDGNIIWEKTTYTVGSNTYNIGSIWSTPAIDDIDNDGIQDIVVGLCGDDTLSTPCRGGVIAYDAFGNLKWYYQTTDRNFPGNSPNGIPDGVRASPTITDLDSDGNKEILIPGGDNYMHVLNAATGTALPNWPQELYDSSFSSPAVADFDNDGALEFTFGADMSESASVCTSGGGMMRVMEKDGSYLPGFDDPIHCGDPQPVLSRGQYVEQVIYSSPAVADINKDGSPEIIVGSGDWYSGKGYWVKVWASDGTVLKTLSTDTYVYASPALGDLNEDGYVDIVAVTYNKSGSPSTLYAWSGQDWSLLWQATMQDFTGASSPALGSPTIADIVPGSAGPEVLIGNNLEISVFSATGARLTSPDGSTGSGPTFFVGIAPIGGQPAVADIDLDGNLEIVVGGTAWIDPYPGGYNPGTDPDWAGYVFAWEWPGATGNATNANLPWPQFRHDAAHSGAVTEPARLSPSPTSQSFYYDPSSGSSANFADNFDIRNSGVSESIDYSVTPPASPPFAITINSATSGTLTPQTSNSFSYDVDLSGLTNGTYEAEFTIVATTTVGCTAAPGSPATVRMRAIVGPRVYLPIISK